MNQTKSRRKLRPLALLLALAGSSLAQAGTEVAPYFYTWGFGNGAYKVKTLMGGKQQAGMTAATLAFGVMTEILIEAKARKLVP